MYLALIALALNFASADTSDCVFQYTLGCSFTKTSEVSFDRKWLDIRFDANGKPDLSGAKKLVEAFTSQHKDLDYSACLSDFGNGLISGRDNADNPACVALEAKYRKQEDAFRKPIRAMVVEYMERQLAANALPYAEPGGEWPTTRDEYDDRNFENFKDLVSSGLARRCYMNAFTDYVSRPHLDVLEAGVSKIPPACRKQIAKVYANILAKMQLDKESCQRNPGPCQARFKQIQATAARLESMGIPVVSGFVRQDTTNNVELVCGLSNQQLMASFSGQFDASNKVVNCTELKVGQSSVIKGDTGAGIGGAYKLSRVSDKEYTASLNLNFVEPSTDPKKPPSPISEKSRETLVKSLRDCFKIVNGHLRIPNGPNINLDLDEPSAASKPYEHAITIDPKLTRVDSDHWTPKIACSTMTHELMHVLGLVDEYEEKWKGTIVDGKGKTREVENLEQDKGGGKKLAKFDCRALGPYNSLMANHRKLFEQYFPDVLIQCECKETDASCLKKLDELNVKFQTLLQDENKEFKTFKDISVTCPNGKEALKSDVSKMKSDEWRKVPNSYSTHDGRKIVIFNAPPPALLHTGHVRAIIYPGCEHKNRLYYQCASQNYQTSTRNKGDDRCDYVPETCTKGEEWLR